MKLTLSDTDRRDLSALIEDDVLEEIDPLRAANPFGTIAVMCADGDQMLDFITRHTNSFPDGPRRHHLLMLNGGAKLLPPDSPLVDADLHENEVLLAHIKSAIRFKGIETVVLYVHFPCAAAYSRHIPALQVLHLLFRAKQVVREAAEPLGVGEEDVIGFCHIDFGQGHKSVYHPRGHGFYAWCAARNISFGD